MNCKFCHKSADIKLTSYNLRLCKSCFLDFFLRRLRQTISKFKMYGNRQTILVAASGGKDSLVLWDALDEAGFRTQGVHINLGIKGHSSHALPLIESFAQQRNLELKVVNARDYIDADIADIARWRRQPPCQICGIIKRYILNQAAANFSSLATGHTLDDQAAMLLGNLLNWQEKYLAHKSIVLPSRGSFSKKIKPLALTSEYEIINYARIRGINYFHDQCPLSQSASSHLYKKVINEIEAQMPSTKLRFYKQFLKGNYFNNNDQQELKPCLHCGSLTTAGICRFCRIKETSDKKGFSKTRR